jgi:hypothetical protein
MNVRSAMVSWFCVRPTSKRWFLIHLMPYRNPCRLYIHLAFTYSVSPSIVVRSELRPAPPFPPIRVLEVYWSRALSLVCEVTLRLQGQWFFWKSDGTGRGFRAGPKNPGFFVWQLPLTHYSSPAWLVGGRILSSKWPPHGGICKFRRPRMDAWSRFSGNERWGEKDRSNGPLEMLAMQIAPPFLLWTLF